MQVSLPVGSFTTVPVCKLWVKGWLLIPGNSLQNSHKTMNKFGGTSCPLFYLFDIKFVVSTLHGEYEPGCYPVSICIRCIMIRILEEFLFGMRLADPGWAIGPA